MTDGQSVALEETSVINDMGGYMGNNLTFHKHVELSVNKANQMRGLIRHAFRYLYVWFPRRMQDINLLENVQRRATTLLPGTRNLTYEDRLCTLRLTSLSYRRLRGDIIEYMIPLSIYIPNTIQTIRDWSQNPPR